MVTPSLRRDSLVLYKARPARIRQSGKKLEIELAGGDRVKVRPKDIALLHPGPLESLGQLQPQQGEPETAWELLAGETTSLADLADLAYGAYTPATAWAAWQLVDDGLYFYGTPKAVVARTPDDLAQVRAAREVKAAAEAARAAFLERVRAAQVLPEDALFLREVEDLALRRRSNSKLLRDLGRAETAESAHALLLDLGTWDWTVDPYPQRLGLPTAEVAIPLPDLPDEPRVDLTHLPAFAIDDEGNEEPDDALSLEGDRLWVHVADVAALVPPDSAADLEARARGATLYLPEGGAPMLPPQAIHRLGLGLADLSPALSFGLDLDTAGDIIDVEIVPSWVRVTRLSYAAADGRLDEEPLRGLWCLAQRCQARRERQGAISLELPEVKMCVDGDQVVIRPLLPLRSRALVTEAMLLAGEGVARFAVERQIPIPFTTQDPPDTDERPQDLAGFFALRRALKPGQPSSVPGLHAGLGLAIYAQTTSPLRRYLDLVVHQQMRAHLRGEPLLDAQQVLERIGAAAAVTGSVRHAERLARRHWTLVYLLQRPGWRGQAILVDKRDRRGTAIIPDLDLDARVHLRQDLPLNSPLTLSLRGVHLATLDAHFEVVNE